MLQYSKTVSSTHTSVFNDLAWTVSTLILNAYRLRRYNNYSLSAEETDTLIALCYLLSPDVLLDKCLFHSEELCGKYNPSKIQAKENKDSYCCQIFRLLTSLQVELRIYISSRVEFINSIESAVNKSKSKKKRYTYLGQLTSGDELKERVLGFLKFYRSTLLWMQ